MANMGAYKCKAENAKGSDETQGKITIKPVSNTHTLIISSKCIYASHFLAIFDAIKLYQLLCSRYGVFWECFHYCSEFSLIMCLQPGQSRRQSLVMGLSFFSPTNNLLLNFMHIHLIWQFLRPYNCITFYAIAMVYIFKESSYSCSELSLVLYLQAPVKKVTGVLFSSPNKLFSFINLFS